MSNIYKIELNGIGSEVVIGNINRDAYQYFIDNDIDLEEYATSSDFEAEIPENYQIFPSGEWFECDNVTHQHGVELCDNSKLVIYDKNDNQIAFNSLEIDVLVEKGIAVECLDEIYLSEKKRECFFLGQSNEEGLFFKTEISINGDFDITKLAIKYVDVEGVNLCRAIYYNNVELTNEDSFTEGTFAEFELIYVD